MLLGFLVFFFLASIDSLNVRATPTRMQTIMIDPSTFCLLFSVRRCGRKFGWDENSGRGQDGQQTIVILLWCHRNTRAIETVIHFFRLTLTLGLWEWTDSGEAPDAILLSFRHVCFAASGEQHQSFSEAILSHLRVSGNSFHILTVQFLFLCYILVSFFKRCSHSGKLGVADAGIASQVHFKLEALHVIIFRSAFPPRHWTWLNVHWWQSASESFLTLHSPSYQLLGFFAMFLACIIVLTF